VSKFWTIVKIFLAKRQVWGVAAGKSCERLGESRQRTSTANIFVSGQPKSLFSAKEEQQARPQGGRHPCSAGGGTSQQ